MVTCCSTHVCMHCRCAFAPQPLLRVHAALSDSLLNVHTHMCTQTHSHSLSLSPPLCVSSHVYTHTHPYQACNRMSYQCVPLYDTLGENAVEYIINHSEVRPSSSIGLGRGQISAREIATISSSSRGRGRSVRAYYPDQPITSNSSSSKGSAGDLLLASSNTPAAVRGVRGVGRGGPWLQRHSSHLFVLTLLPLPLPLPPPPAPPSFCSFKPAPLHFTTTTSPHTGCAGVC